MYYFIYVTKFIHNNFYNSRVYELQSLYLSKFNIAYFIITTCTFTPGVNQILWSLGRPWKGTFMCQIKGMYNSTRDCMASIFFYIVPPQSQLCIISFNLDGKLMSFGVVGFISSF